MQESIRDVLRYSLLAESSPGVISKYTNKSWLKSAVKKNNYVGPNGNEVVAYVWKWKWGLRYSAHEGGDVEVRVSDWDNAEECTTCQRKIVHVFFVLDKADNQVKPYGFDHTHKALGIEKELSQSLITKIKNSVSIPPGQKELSKVDEKRLAIVFRLYQRMSGETPEDARIKASHYGGYSPQVDTPLFYHTEEKRYVYLVGNKITPAVLKRVTTLIPEFKRIEKDEAIKIWKIQKGNQKIAHFAKSSASDANCAVTNARLPQSGKYLWAVNIKKRLIMRVTAGSIMEDPDFTKLFPDWEVGGPELANKFRKAIEQK